MINRENLLLGNNFVKINCQIDHEKLQSHKIDQNGTFLCGVYLIKKLAEQGFEI